MHNTEKLINDISVQNETSDFFSKCKQIKLTKFIHIRISTGKSIGKKTLKKFGLKKLPSKGTIVKSRLELENNPLDILFALNFHLHKQELIIK